MPDVLEQPTTLKRPLPPGLTPFDHARAVLAGQRSGQVRRERAAAKLLPPHVPNVQEAAEPAERLALLAEQITRTRKALNGRLQPHHRAALLRALCELLDQQRIARGEPLPGSRRPRDQAPAASRPIALMVDEAPPA